jgi:WD40 repeat protein
MKIKIFVYAVFLLACSFHSFGQDTIWNGYRIQYVGKTEISRKMDGYPNARLRIDNISNTGALPLYFDLFIDGFTAPNLQRNLHGEFGWATFPNGGALQIKQGDSSYAQCWTQGAYDGRMGNIPPASGTTKTYTVHFLFSENQGALQGPYPKDPGTVLDLPVHLEFTNDDTVQLYRSGEKAIRLSVQPKSGGDFQLELFTESGGVQQNNVFNPTLFQRGDGVGKPFLFDFRLALRDDWIVKIRKPGMKSEYFRIDTTGPFFSVSLKEEMLGNSSLKVGVKASVKTPTGFWRGAVSEQTKTFVCIPGQENWAVTSSPKTASKVYKLDFDGKVLWTTDIGWEAWGGDMSADGKMVAVASNGATIPTALNGNRGGDFIALFNGLDGSLYDTIVKGIQSRNIKFSSDGKFLAIGDQSGVFHIYDVVQKKLIQTGTGQPSFGQNRELEWMDEDNALVISTGDGQLRKYGLSADKRSATLIWRAYTGGWGFINGLTISRDGKYIGTGTKSKEQTILNAATGEVLWRKFTGNFDAAFSADGNRLATFGGYIFETLTGKFLGHTGRGGVAWFSADGKYLMQADRVQYANGQYGDNAVTVMNEIGDKLPDADGKMNYVDSLDQSKTGGEQSQWAYWTEDGKRIIVLSRDMDLTQEVGITIFNLEQCNVAAPEALPVNVCQGTLPEPLTATAYSGNSLRWYGTNATGGTASATPPSPSRSVPGQTTYYVSQVSANGCESNRRAIVFTVLPLPAKPIIVQSGAQLSATAGMSSYQWLLNNNAISGATGNVYVPVVSGGYRVRGTNVSGCADTSMVFNYVLTSLSQSLFEGKVVRMYPNPIGNRVMVDLGQIPLMPVAVHLMTIDGKILDRWIIRDKRNELEIGNIQKGAYWFKVSNGKSSVVLPVVK